MAANSPVPYSGTLGSVGNGFNTLDDDELDAWLADDSADEKNETPDKSCHGKSSECLIFSPETDKLRDGQISLPEENNTPHVMSNHVKMEDNDSLQNVKPTVAGVSKPAASSQPSPEITESAHEEFVTSAPVKDNRQGLTTVKIEAQQKPEVETIHSHKMPTVVVEKTKKLAKKPSMNKGLVQQAKESRLDIVPPAFEEKSKRQNKPRIRDLIDHKILEEGDRLNYLAGADDRGFPCSVTSHAFDIDKRLLVDLSELPLLLKKIPFLVKLQEDGVKGIAFVPIPDSSSPKYLLMSISFFKLLALWCKEDFSDTFRFQSDLHAYDDKEMVVVKMRGLVLPDPVPLKAIRDQFAEEVGWDFEQGVCRCAMPHPKPEGKSRRNVNVNDRKSAAAADLWALGRSTSTKSSGGGSGRRPQSLETAPDGQRKRAKVSAEGQGTASDSVGGLRTPQPDDVKSVGDGDSVSPVVDGSNTGGEENTSMDNSPCELTNTAATPSQKSNGGSHEAVDREAPEVEEEKQVFVFDPDAFFDKVRSPEFLDRARLSSVSGVTSATGSSPRGETKRRVSDKIMSMENVKNLLASWDSRKKSSADLNRMVSSICTHEDTRNAMQRQFQAAAKALSKAEKYIDVRTPILKLMLIVGDDRKYVGMYAAEAVMLACENGSIKSGLQKDVAAKEVLRNLRARYGGLREKINAKAGDLLAKTILGKIK